MTSMCAISVRSLPSSCVNPLTPLAQTLIAACTMPQVAGKAWLNGADSVVCHAAAPLHRFTSTIFCRLCLQVPKQSCVFVSAGAEAMMSSDTTPGRTNLEASDGRLTVQLTLQRCVQDRHGRWVGT